MSDDSAFSTLTLSRGVEECVTIFTSDGPVQVEVGYFKNSHTVALRFITPKGMLVLRNELLDEKGQPCPSERSISGKSISQPSTPAATSLQELLAQYSAKRAADLSKQESSKTNPDTTQQKVGTTV